MGVPCAQLPGACGLGQTFERPVFFQKLQKYKWKLDGKGRCLICLSNSTLIFLYTKNLFLQISAQGCSDNLKLHFWRLLGDTTFYSVWIRIRCLVGTSTFFTVYGFVSAVCLELQLFLQCKDSYPLKNCFWLGSYTVSGNNRTGSFRTKPEPACSGSLPLPAAAATRLLRSGTLLGRPLDWPPPPLMRLRPRTASWWRHGQDDVTPQGKNIAPPQQF